MIPTGAIDATAPATATLVSDSTQQSEVVASVKAKKSTKCWNCGVDSHTTKSCPVQHYYLVCDNAAHPTFRCPMLRLPKPSCFTLGHGIDETIFVQFPDSVYKPHLIPATSPTALVTVAGEPVPAKAIESLMSRMCPSSQWTWEALPHGDDAYIIGFPSVEDLQRVDGIQLNIPSFKAQASIVVWKTQDVEPIRVLEKVWVHVQGVPYAVKHFLGFWAVGTLIGTTLDVDLATYRSRGIVRILVGMLDSKVLEKRISDDGPYIRVACVVKLKEYGFYFGREAADFIPDPNFVPFLWRRKGDKDDEEEGNDHSMEGSVRQNISHGSLPTNMEVDANLSDGMLNASKSGTSGAQASMVIAITPYNSCPSTEHGREIVERIRRTSPSLLRPPSLGSWKRRA